MNNDKFLNQLAQYQEEEQQFLAYVKAAATADYWELRANEDLRSRCLLIWFYDQLNNRFMTHSLRTGGSLVWVHGSQAQRQALELV